MTGRTVKLKTLYTLQFPPRGPCAEVTLFAELSAVSTSRGRAPDM